MKNFLINFLFINLILFSSAQAYVDPGSASIVVQVIIGLIAGFIATMKLWWKKFVDFFSKVFKKKKN